MTNEAGLEFEHMKHGLSLEEIRAAFVCMPDQVKDPFDLDTTNSEKLAYLCWLHQRQAVIRTVLTQALEKFK